MVRLGDEVKDKVSGFKGIVVAKTEYLNGCFRCGVQPKVDKEGKLPEAQWFDEPQLEPTKKKRIPEGKKDTGGPAYLIPKQRTICKR